MRHPTKAGILIVPNHGSSEVGKGLEQKIKKDAGMQKFDAKNKLSRPIQMTLEKTETGFSAYSNDFPIYTTGTTIPELIDNAIEASFFYFQGEKISISAENIKFEIDFQQFFQYYRVLNSKFLAEKIGMNPTLLSQYVQGQKKPSGKQTRKIIDGIHQIGIELSQINLIAN